MATRKRKPAPIAGKDAARMAELVGHCERLFPGAGYLLAIAPSGGMVQTSAKIPNDLHRLLMRTFLFEFARESELVITTVRIPHSKEPS